MKNQSLIPHVDPYFEKFSIYNDIKNVIKSRKFFPVFIAGHSGLGKTHSVLQACAELKRECVRLNFSTETDQSDLIGSNTLIDGNIVFQEGPVLTALRLGAILLMDDVDRANQQILTSLFSILEGNGVFISKTGEFVYPTEGFNIIMTANTKGYGDDSGKYLAHIMDEALLERMCITIDFPWASEKTEKQILLHYLNDKEFVDNLVKWANVIRKTYENGGITSIISTRRLIHVANTYDIFKDKLKAIKLCCSRFDDYTAKAFVDLYTKIDSGIDISLIEEDFNDEENY